MRNYRKEYDNYQGKPEQIKRRASRNKARIMMVKKGLMSKNSPKDVAHLNNNPLDDRISNFAAQSKHQNRSFPRTSKGHMAKR